MDGSCGDGRDAGRPAGGRIGESVESDRKESECRRRRSWGRCAVGLASHTHAKTGTISAPAVRSRIIPRMRYPPGGRHRKARVSSVRSTGKTRDGAARVVPGEAGPGPADGAAEVRGHSPEGRGRLARRRLPGHPRLREPGEERRGGPRQHPRGDPGLPGGPVRDGPAPDHRDESRRN